MKKGLKLYVCLIMAMFLLSSHAFAAEKVYFYHTDPAGTPLAMTDTSGNVVWRAVYKPFGEEHSVTQNPENDMMFVGKEKDKETGLYYFGARYMNDKIGRFVSPDPIGPVDPGTSKTNYEMLTNPQLLNRYAYSLNNPYKYLDPNGKWPEEVHNTIIESAFSSGNYKLSPSAMAALKRGSAKSDTLQYQDPAHSYVHAMRNASYSNQTKEEAERLMNDFISSKIREYKSLLAKNSDKAYEALGMAMHPLMDATSPSHEGFQGWAGMFPVIDGTTMKAYIHGSRETEDVFNSNLEYSRRAVDAIRMLYDAANR